MKKLWKRIHWWYIWLSILLLVDEKLKEGYFFNPDDLLKPLTHENIWLIATLAYIITNMLLVIQRWKRDRHNSRYMGGLFSKDRFTSCTRT